MYTTFVPGALKGKNASDPLELKLLVVVNFHMDSGFQTQVLCKGRKCSKLQNHPFSPLIMFYVDNNTILQTVKGLCGKKVSQQSGCRNTTKSQHTIQLI